MSDPSPFTPEQRAALHEAAVLQSEQDVLEKLLRNGFLLGEVADEDGSMALFAREQDHCLETVLPFPGKHRKSTNSTMTVDYLSIPKRLSWSARIRP